MDEKEIECKINELDEIMDKIELLFLNNSSIKEEHNGQYIEHQDFLDEVKKLLKNKFYSKNKHIQRYNITPIFQNNLMTGIEYQHDIDGNWVNYNDVKNLVDDTDEAILKLKNVISILNSEHRTNREAF